MKLLDRERQRKIILNAIRNFIIFFILIAFVVTCNFLLFLHSMDLNEAQVREYAPRTFWNIILLTVVFCVLDSIRRAWTVSRPVKRITDGIDIIMSGDFSYRIPYIKGENSNNEFDVIIKGLNHMTEELSSVETL